ncbi:NAD(P)-dependent oxidoreductase [Afifella sp. H1R]|uniref:NAD(P)-dependent oxidoreductase n=1 Tax=Afifella sp. H1R TaxID=2908841 RepID=UPI001F2E5DF4|nr:NAD(P)-dependent oxidoreductase [Afifella sp. H1R]
MNQISSGLPAATPAGEPDICAARLNVEDYLKNFSDLHPPLSPHEALVEADRCYFCFDAPCTEACPTSIDIPLFIRQIQAHNSKGAAETIFEQNILGGMCARVCPVETLCEEACVRNLAEDKPVKIGFLQRFATDAMMAAGEHPFERAALSGKRVAIVGAGPAGLSCAHRLAMHGHDVTIFEARDKPGGLNEYGIAAYKTPDGFAQKEVEFLLRIGGITIETGKALGRELSLDGLKADYDAIFLGLGLAGVNALGAEGEDASGSADAITWISDLRQTLDLSTLPIGRRVVVIGGGMTAVDAAVQSKLLGAEEVTIVYRRGPEAMKASGFEQELAQTKGVTIRHWAKPKRLLAENGHVAGIELERTREEDGRLVGTGETFALAADMVFKAIGQTFLPASLDGAAEAIALARGRIDVDDERRTSVTSIWAGGDCVLGGEDLTVAAVEDGKVAAESIHRALMG